MGKLVHSLASLFRRQQSPCLIHDVFPLPHVLYQLAKKKKKKTNQPTGYPVTCPSGSFIGKINFSVHLGQPFSTSVHSMACS